MSDLKKKNFIENLSSAEAERVLSELYDEFPELEDKIYDIALKEVSGVDEDDIMHDVFYELEELDIDDLYNSSGSTRYGYVDPNELSWEMFEETLTPFIDEMKKSQDRDLPNETKSYCCGMIKGLRMYEKEASSEFSDWVKDAPSQYIDVVLKEFKKGNPSDEDLAQVEALVQR